MLNSVWGGMIIVSIVCAIFTKNTKQLGIDTLEGAKNGLELLLVILPMLVMWSGIMEIASKSGLSDKIAKIFRPLLKRLFPNLDADSDAFKYICLNVSANILGLGNAATPFGLKAMNELKRLSPHSDTASDEMMIFVLMNTASIQLIPTTVGTLRYNAGSQSPFDILPCVWITSAAALAFGLTAVLCCIKTTRSAVVVGA